MTPDDHTDLRWVEGNKIQEVLGDVSTGRCTTCGAPARVPEDVVAVRQQGEQRFPIIVCERCQPSFMESLKNLLDKMEKRGDL